MFNIGEMVKIKHNNKIGVILSREEISGKYVVFTQDEITPISLFAEQIEKVTFESKLTHESARVLNATLTANLLNNPSIDSLYSLNSSKIDFIPYQFRPVLKIIKSETPRILIADGVGVGKTIEAGLILKELEARFDIKSVLVICPRPLITERKWQNELKDKFGEKFVHIDGDKLRYCINECYLDEEWPDEYAKCIIPYSLFDEAIVNGTAEGGLKKIKKKSLSDLKPFPKFDLVIVDEAHHVKNTNTYAYQAVETFCENATSVVMLTATPIQLGNKDLFTLLNILRPDLIYDYENFERISEPNPFINEAVRFIRGNTADWQQNALTNLIAAAKTSFGKINLLPNPIYQKTIVTLRQETVTQEERVKLITDTESLHSFATIINRTRRRDIGAFTIRKPETLKVSFTADQSTLYNELLRIQANILRQLHGDKGLRFMMTTIMRQASSCIHGLRPFLEDILTRRFDELGFTDDYMDGEVGDMSAEYMSKPQIIESVRQLLAFTEGMSNDDTKVEELIKAVKNKQSMQNNKVMVFSSFRHTLRYLYEKLSAQNIRVGIIHGGVKDEERVILRNRFKADKNQEDSLDVLLFSEVGCEGLDYQFCDCLVNYDLPWNPQAIEQRIGRIDRNGQKSESISIINIITEGTIDCDIYDRCLSRIGVFNSSIGDSEEILGEVTREIYDMVEKYILNPQERAQKELQIADNAIRKMQEQRRLEEEKHAFFGLDLSEEVIQKELQDATNIHLSADAIVGLVETYLEKRLGAESQYVIGNGVEKKLRLNADNRQILLSDYKTLNRQVNPVYRAWENYLNNKTPFEQITFDGKYAAEHNDVTFIMPTHPIVKQAIRYFGNIPIQCNLAVQSDNLRCGEYPFVIYEWQYKGVKPNCVLQVVTSEEIDSKLMLALIYNAKDLGVAESFDCAELENKHFALWKSAKERYVAESEQSIRFKLSSLVSSQQGQVRAVENILSKATDERIIKMKKAQLDRLEQSFNEKQANLKAEIDKCDIVSAKLAVGILRVED